jgi:CBS domain-containing protein
MPIVQDILSRKGNQIFSLPPTASVLDAIHLMNRQGVGALLVMQNGQMAGMFTERDVLRRVLEAEKPVAELRIAEVMTTKVICGKPGMEIEEASQIMQSKRIRHLPVCDDDGELLGMISIGDLNALYANHQQQTIESLTGYIYGRV